MNPPCPWYHPFPNKRKGSWRKTYEHSRWRLSLYTHTNTGYTLEHSAAKTRVDILPDQIHLLITFWAFYAFFVTAKYLFIILTTTSWWWSSFLLQMLVCVSVCVCVCVLTYAKRQAHPYYIRRTRRKSVIHPGAFSSLSSSLYLFVNYDMGVPKL
jgi:membrane-anchored protein YejM (alkaline phosphatase superfamily)